MVALIDTCSLRRLVELLDETRNANDGKIFKKLPVCCELVDITSENIVDYLKENGVDIKWIVSKQ